MHINKIVESNSGVLAELRTIEQDIVTNDFTNNNLHKFIEVLKVIILKPTPTIESFLKGFYTEDIAHSKVLSKKAKRAYLQFLNSYGIAV